MTICEKDISSSECLFIDDSKVKEFYDEFIKICDDNSIGQKCCTETQDNSECCSSVVDNMNKLKHRINHILQTHQVESNGISSYRNVEDLKILCICLKRSFYNKVIGDKNKSMNVYKILNTCNRKIRDKINDFPSSLCTFRNLNIEEMERIKNIYDFYLFYYRNIKDLAVDQKLNKKPEDCSYGCVLSQRLFNGHYLLKLREEIQKIRSGYRSTNSQTTAITVVSLVIGTVVGVFLISYYFFGITPSVICLRIRKKMNKETHAKIDNETESNSLFTSENLENNSKSKGYSILYKSTKYS
ncbi:PIR Superfamily Protein [Plasmodium ovale curtisi]|uniref:PIR Superfamily Protein n=1 Tax=Plasmodium ovale curtisi TaxID=864141 RepID=A0A1A8WRU4_PLAOA|nr:PIR Superfamily Protein [Plasmodium ovale curtisi]